MSSHKSASTEHGVGLSYRWFSCRYDHRRKRKKKIEKNEEASRKFGGFSASALKRRRKDRGEKNNLKPAHEKQRPRSTAILSSFFPPHCHVTTEQLTYRLCDLPFRPSRVPHPHRVPTPQGTPQNQPIRSLRGFSRESVSRSTEYGRPSSGGVRSGEWLSKLLFGSMHISGRKRVLL